MGAKKKTSKVGKLKKTASSALGAVMGASKGRGKGRKGRKKSALWYAKEIQRIRLKRKYERVKLSLGR